MAATAVQNPPVQAESKSAKKKKAKLERTESPAPASVGTPTEKPSSVAGDGEDGENPYIRDMQKNIRNVNKKISNITKTEAVVSEHKGKTLDELVKLKIINADQKASIQKKEGLQAQLAQLEEQLSQYKKIDQEYRTRANQIKTELEKTLSDRYEKEKADALAEVKAELSGAADKTLHDSLLVMSQFLRLAAARRGEEHDPELDENRALEGVLLQVYSGDEEGVATMLKLVQGSSEKAKSVASEPLEATFAQIKQAAVAHAVPLYTEGAAAETETTEPATDPTIANAGLTEIDAGADIVITNGHSAEASAESANTGAPANADVGEGAANAAADSQWDAGNASMSASQEWVEVPREPAETDNGLNATPAAPANTQSWADDAADHAAEAPAVPADPNDGFQSVQGRNRGRGDREGGNWRGRGNYRGNRGFRGDGRGRGRGRGRGGNGGQHHQQRNTDES
ncbi:hypothetical protein MCOR03_009470 [Pyricularia oryzae]|nr:hypothetical protein MCOR03_009470 [Pyricularia oryzae]